MFIDPWGLEYIPLRATIEGLGGSVTWNSSTKQANVKLDGQSIQVYSGDGIGSFIGEDNKMYVWDEWLFPLLSTTFDLGKGWNGRIERHGSGNGFKKHVVITDKNNNEYSQNEDGSPHDKGGSPPNKIKKRLKDKTGWDWDAKEDNWLSKIEVKSGIDGRGFVITYPNKKTVTVKDKMIMGVYVPFSYPTSQELIDYYTGPSVVNPNTESNQGTIPITPMLNPGLLPIPTPTPVPAFGF